jgi:hypothetical protein
MAATTEAPKANLWHDIWVNKRHYQIYIFGLAVLGLVFAFVANFASISIVYNKKIKEMYANAAVFTPNAVMSLSGVTAQVMSFRVNTAKNQMFLLVKLNNTQDISFNIRDYQMYVTNVDKDMKRTGKPKESIRGQYYMFGATGYVGIYIYTNSKFSDDYKWITIRNFNPVTTNRQPYVSYLADDYKYDQYHIFINPSGKTVNSIDFLENHQLTEAINTTEVYKQIIAENQERDIKANIATSYSTLENTLSHINEYRRRLEREYKLIVPGLPSMIDGDRVDLIVNENGTTRKEFVFASTVKGGIDLDWMNLSLRIGYYQSYYESNLYSLKEFLANRKEELEEKTTVSESVVVQPNDWVYDDGRSKIDMINPDMQGLINEINTYNNYLTSYLAEKTTLQTKLYISLLELEQTTNTYMSSAQILTDITEDDGSYRPALQTW